MFLQFVAQSARQIGHLIPVNYMMDVKPFQQLRHTIRRLAPVPEPGLQFISGLRFDVGQQHEKPKPFYAANPFMSEKW